MQKDKSKTSKLAALFVTLTSLSLGVPAFAGVDTKEVLVLDFIGFKDQGKDHAQTFQETVLPDADLVSIGIHGIIPDAWRKGTGYDTIIRAGSARDYERSASEVYGLIKKDQTILAVDFNEHGLPRQLRPTNKILRPAMVAARVAERWRKEHPDGLLILRGHSDGTYAETYIFDYLKGKKIPPDAVILESPRQMYSRWAKRAKESPETLVLAVTSADDLPREWFLGKGYDKVPSDNWINFHVKGLRGPLSAHSIVTDYRSAALKIQRTDTNGRTSTENVTLGKLIQEELAHFFSHRKRGAPAPPVERSVLPSEEERKKVLPNDPWDKGGGGNGVSGIGSSSPNNDSEGISPSAAATEPRGGVSADIQINPHDFSK